MFGLLEANTVALDQSRAISIYSRLYMPSTTFIPEDALDERRLPRRRPDWNKRFAVFWSSIFTLLAASVVLTQVSPIVQMLHGASWIADVTLPLFIILVAVVLVAIAWAYPNDTWNIVVAILLLSLMTAPSVLTVMAPRFQLSMWFFVVSLTIWTISGVIGVTDNSHNPWLQVLLWLGTASSVMAVLCEIGLFAPIRFAEEPLRRAYGLSILLDLRLTLSAIFGALCIVTAAVRELSTEGPDIPELPIPEIPKLPEQHKFLAALANPPIIILNAAIFAFITVANVLVGFVGTVVSRAFFTGVEFGKLLWQLLFEAQAALQVLKTLSAMTVTYAVVIMAFQLAPGVREYLRGASSLSAGHLPSIVLVFVVVLFGATLSVLILDGRATDMSLILSGSSLVAMLFLFAGGLLYAFARTQIVKVEGFDTVGPLTLVGAGFLLLGAGVVPLANLSAHRKQDTSELPPPHQSQDESRVTTPRSQPSTTSAPAGGVNLAARGKDTSQPIPPQGEHQVASARSQTSAASSPTGGGNLAARATKDTSVRTPPHRSQDGPPDTRPRNQPSAASPPPDNTSTKVS